MRAYLGKQSTLNIKIQNNTIEKSICMHMHPPPPPPPHTHSPVILICEIVSHLYHYKPTSLLGRVLS